jgi:hypothetical protein
MMRSRKDIRKSSIRGSVCPCSICGNPVGIVSVDNAAECEDGMSQSATLDICIPCLKVICSYAGFVLRRN